MLGSASGSLPNHPGHPPAAPGGLVSLVPDLVLGPRKPLDIGELQQPGRTDTTRFFGTGSRVPMDWAASAIKPGRRSLHGTSMVHGRATCRSGYLPNRHGGEPRCGGAAWGRLARHQGTLSTRAHAEYGRDQAMGSPCYPDEGCFLAMDGSVLLDDPNAYLGRVLKGRGAPNHEL